MWRHLNAMAFGSVSALICHVAQQVTSRDFANAEDALYAIEQATALHHKRSSTVYVLVAVLFAGLWC